MSKHFMIKNSMLKGGLEGGRSASAGAQSTLPQTATITTTTTGRKSEATKSYKNYRNAKKNLKCVGK